MKPSKNGLSYLILDGFWLKIIALLTMTIDHVGVALGMYYGENPQVMAIVNVCRIIGRLALPIFCFLIVEGVLHTRNFKRYLLNMGVIAAAVLISQIFMEYVMKLRVAQGNIFFDLILGAIAVKCLMDKRIWIKAIALLPIAFGVVSFIFYGLDFSGAPIAKYFPYFLRSQYHWYSIALVVAFYLSYPIAKWLLNNTSSFTGLDYEMTKDNNLYRIVVNSISILFLSIITIGLYLIGLFMDPIKVFWDIGLQNYALISCALLLLYNGKRGYNSIAFKYGCYIYYPLHILLAYGIVYLTFIL